jgi:hypothetical protein
VAVPVELAPTICSSAAVGDIAATDALAAAESLATIPALPLSLSAARGGIQMQLDS